MTRITLSDLITAHPTPQARGMVCFTWDDSYSDFATLVQPLADSLHQRHTFCCVSDFIDTANHLTSAQVTSLYDDGHEIASHSKTHTDMTSLTSAQRQAEWDTSKSALETLSAVGAVTTFTYPFGAFNGATHQESYLRYDRLLLVGSANTGFHLYHPLRTQVQQIRRFQWTNSNQQHLLSLIRRCAVQPWRLVILAHDPSTGSEPTWTNVQEAMNLAATLKVPCVTAAEAFPSNQLVPNAGFENTSPGTDLGPWQGTVTGTGVAEVVADTPSTGLNGSQSLHLKGLADTDTALAKIYIPCPPSTQMTVQGRYRVSLTSGAGSVTASIQQYAGDGSAIGSATTTAALTSTSWAQFSASISSPANNTAFILITLSLANVTGQAWFDHIHLAPTYEGSFG